MFRLEHHEVSSIAHGYLRRVRRVSPLPMPEVLSPSGIRVVTRQNVMLSLLSVRLSACLACRDLGFVVN